MKFMNKLCRGYEIASVTQALTFKDVYIFDAKLKAPRLLEIDTLEEVECPLVEIQVSENTIQLPSNWHVMIFETENFTIDTIPVALSQVYENMTPGFQFNATDGILQNIVPKKLPMIGIRYGAKNTMVFPSLQKYMAFLIPINETTTIIAGPHDLSRYISTLALGDIQE